MILDEKYIQYLKDESRREGQAEEIFFPETISALKAVMHQLSGKKHTIQGARTGLYGAAVPHGGAVVNLTKMKGLTGIKKAGNDGYELTALAGTTLAEVKTFCRLKKSPLLPESVTTGDGYREFLKGTSFFLAVESSEDTATIGGMTATAAKGVSDCQMGGIKKHLIEIQGIAADGTTRSCSADSYYRDREQIAVITAVTLRLIPRPTAQWGIVFFFGESEFALRFGQKVQMMNERVDCYYYHHTVCSMIDRLRSRMTKLAELPPFIRNRQAVIYVELSADDEEEIETQLLEIVELYLADGGEEEDTWAASGDGIEKLRLIGHLALEAEGAYFDEQKREWPGLMKQTAEFVLPQERYVEFAEKCRRLPEAEGLPFLCFGRIGDCHLHIGIFQDSAICLEQLTQCCVQMGGRLSGHYGAVWNLQKAGGA